MRRRTLGLAAIIVAVCAGSGCWIFEEGESGGGVCTGGPVTVTLPVQVFCEVERIASTISGPDMETIEISIDKENPSATLQVPSGEDRKVVVQIYTTDDPQTPAYTSPPAEFCVDAGQPVTITVSVSAGNSNPEINGVEPAAGQFSAGQTVRLTADASDPDACDRVQSYRWSTAFGSVTGSGAAATWVPQCPAGAASCQATVQLAVTDTRGGSDSGSFSYTVGTPNTPPAVSLTMADTLVNQECWGVDLTATVSDPEGDPVTLSWRIVSGSGELINVSGSTDTTATWDSRCAGTVDTVVEVTATDAGGASATATARILNRAPSVTLDPPVANPLMDCTWDFTAHGQDADGDSLLYSWSSGTGQISFGPADNAISYFNCTPCANQVPAVVEVRVSDAHDASATAQWTFQCAIPLPGDPRSGGWVRQRR